MVGRPMNVHDLAEIVIALSPLLENLSIVDLVAWAQDIQRGPCQSCTNGVVIETEHGEFVLCPLCQGDSRQRPNS